MDDKITYLVQNGSLVYCTHPLLRYAESISYYKDEFGINQYNSMKSPQDKMKILNRSTGCSKGSSSHSICLQFTYIDYLG